MKPDYDRIAELERAIYGEILTMPKAAAVAAFGVNRLRALAEEFQEPAPEPAVHELDSALRETALFLAWRRVPVFEGSRVFSVCRALVWAVLMLAVVWLCLMVAGVVPWSS